LQIIRAPQVDHRLALTATKAPHVARICRLVEGMPLGIELAAAWVGASGGRQSPWTSEVWISKTFAFLASWWYKSIQ
jgi:hypothetical protein